MYNFLDHTHSGLRYVVLILLILAIYKGFSGRRELAKGKSALKPFGLGALIVTHLQLVIGLVLYLKHSVKVNFDAGWMKNPISRFYGMEHTLGMLIAIILITIGYSKAKRAATVAKTNSTIWKFYLAGLILILASIPWPFRNLGAGWF